MVAGLKPSPKKGTNTRFFPDNPNAMQHLSAWQTKEQDLTVRCKECGGGSICQHGRLGWQCKDCGGSSICQHGTAADKGMVAGIAWAAAFVSMADNGLGTPEQVQGLELRHTDTIKINPINISRSSVHFPDNPDTRSQNPTFPAAIVPHPPRVDVFIQ